MITLVLLIIGFFIGGGVFGAQIINAFDITQYWLWIVATIATLISALMVLGGAMLGKDKLGRLGAVGGTAVGGIVAMVICFVSYTELWLSYFIIENVDENVTSWSDLSSNAQYGIIAFGIILMVSMYKSSKIKSE